MKRIAIILLNTNTRILQRFTRQAGANSEQFKIVVEEMKSKEEQKQLGTRMVVS